MDITIHASFLPHNDPDAALAFYRDTLGFEVRNDVGYAGMRGSRSSRRPPDTAIVLNPPEANPGSRRRASHVFAEMMAQGHLGRHRAGHMMMSTASSRGWNARGAEDHAGADGPAIWRSRLRVSRSRGNMIRIQQSR